ncbi:GspE/PulE family protein [Leptothrix discophora]|uniref:ATPase, T2SS/T4P/T4SS family n=1 Tax=Leptothrix discophora TaxID=89 RepID=A0ABT9G3F8_LEPDI|nr:ATPase, T2SS/T4P/T4SS family [Leptothrix discophora]MDP4300987.1 ATPase, T2SS/T4P/T4SS family [Leptothrix discophora]
MSPPSHVAAAAGTPAVISAGSPTSGGVGASGAASSWTPYAWPTPPLAAYPQPTPSLEPEPCEIESRGGQLMMGLLVEFDVDEGQARVLLPPDKLPVALRFSQIRRITLKRSLAPLSAAMVADASGDAIGQVLGHRRSLTYTMHLQDGGRLSGRTVGHLDTPAGLFLFAPVDALGSVQRIFVPRAMLTQHSIGEPLGQMLVEQMATTSDELEQALAEQQAQRNRKLGEQLIARQLVTPEQLLAALDTQARMPTVRLGEALVQLSFITEAQLQQALDQQRAERAQPLGELLVQRGVVDVQHLRVALARKLGYPVVDVDRFPVEPSVAALLPLADARRLQVLPLMRRGGRLVVAMTDTSRHDLVTELERLTQAHIAPTLAGSGSLRNAIERAYGGAGDGIHFDLDDRDRANAEIVKRNLPAAVTRATRQRPPADRALTAPMGLGSASPVQSPGRAPARSGRAAVTAAAPVEAAPERTIDAGIAVPDLDLSFNDPVFNDPTASATAVPTVPPVDAVIDLAASPAADPAADPVAEVISEPVLAPGPDANARSADPVEATTRPTDPAELSQRARAAAARHESPLLQSLSNIVLDALARGASSVQIEAMGTDDKLQVRLRRHGRLEAHSELPATWRGPLLARIKALADLDISDTRKPQEGRLSFARLVPQHAIDLRVLTLPTHDGLEDVVLGLPARLKPFALEAIGLPTDDLARLRQLLDRPAGLILCAGPARSGRTTTLHAMLAHLNRPERRIWTLEERIERLQPGLRQMEVRAEEGQSMEVALRSLMNTDADVIMVGQIGDAATARLAVDAALRGRLVIAGMTARSAGDAVMRLIDQGVPAWDLADALLGVHSQRLLRRLCNACRMSRTAKDSEVDDWVDGYFHGGAVEDAQADREALLKGWVERHGRDGRLRRYQSQGCERCGHTGVRGRIAVHELLTLSRDLRRLVRAGAPGWNLQRQAAHEGLHSLRQDALDKMVAGQISLDEVRSLVEI